MKVLFAICLALCIGWCFAGPQPAASSNRQCQHGGILANDLCICQPGWVGQYCQNPAKIPHQAASSNGQCQHGGILANDLCICQPGWVGQYCQNPAKIPHQAASSNNNPCQNGGIFYQGSCTCLQGFVGQFCQNTEKNLHLVHGRARAGKQVPKRAGLFAPVKKL